MALGMRSKKSPNERKPFGRGKSAKFDSNGDDSKRGRGEREERKSLSTEKRFARRGRDSDIQTSGRKPFNGRRMSFVKDDADEEMGSQRAGRPMRGDRRRSEANDRFKSSGRIVGRRQGGIRDDGSEVKARSWQVMRYCSKMKKDRMIPFRSAVIDELRLRGRILSRKRREALRNDSEGTIGREMRGDRRRKRDDKGGETEESSDFVEASSGKRRLKWKKMDKKRQDTGDANGDAKGNTSENIIKSEGEGSEIDEQKPVRRYTRVLNKFGKKINVVTKHSDDSTAEKLYPVRKKKRVMKIDPRDTSNKRLDDSLLTSGNS